MNHTICTGGDGREDEGEDGQIDGQSPTGREEDGLAALEGLSLEELADLANREIGEAGRLQSEAIGLSRMSTAAFYRAGRILWCVRKRHKGKRAWTRWQKDHGIKITSAWQAIRLYEAAEGEEAVAGLNRTQALKKYGITKPKKVQPQPAPVGDDTAHEGPGEAPGAGGTATIQVAPPETPDLRLAPEREAEAGGTATVRQRTEVVRPDEGEEPQADPTTPPPSFVLVQIARRLELLERDIRGADLGDEAHALIDRAIATLRRLRGVGTPETEAA